MSFQSGYSPDTDEIVTDRDTSSISEMKEIAPGIDRFLSRYAGLSFNRGLYRIHPVGEIPRWTANVVSAFPDFKERVFCFSYDWLGRHFGIDSGRRQKNQCQTLMLEPGTGQALEIPANFRDFHDLELVEHQNEALASDFYGAWLAAGGAVPGLSQCIGYKKPLFLGGEDVVENLELTDMEVYWSVCGQLLARIRDLPLGTKIRDIRIV